MEGMEGQVGQSGGEGLKGKPRAANLAKHKFGWKARLMDIMRDEIKRHSTRDKVVGNETQAKRRAEMFQFFTELRILGYKIEDPKNFCNKHIHALCLDWEARGLAAKTIVNRISMMRWFAGLIGKEGMVGAPETYVRDPKSVQIQRAAVEDKSWGAKGIIPEEKIAEVAEYCPETAAQMMACLGLGARVREAVCLRPHLVLDGEFITLQDGTKNGRRRTFRATPKMLEALEHLQKITPGKFDYLGSCRTLKQSRRRFYTVMERFGITRKGLGITAHGLRAQFLIDMHEEETGVAAPVRGGMPGDCDPVTKHKADRKVAEAAGHSRTSVTTAYCGSYQAMAKERARQEALAARGKVQDSEG